MSRGDAKHHYRVKEVCELADVQPYVLKFWEQEIPQLAPEKGRTGQKVYRRKDVDLIRRIRHLVYERDFTIAAVRQALKDGRDGRSARSGSRQPAAGHGAVGSPGSSSYAGRAPAGSRAGSGSRGDVRDDLSGLLFDGAEARDFASASAAPSAGTVPQPSPAGSQPVADRPASGKASTVAGTDERLVSSDELERVAAERDEAVAERLRLEDEAATLRMRLEKAREEVRDLLAIFQPDRPDLQGVAEDPDVS